MFLFYVLSFYKKGDTIQGNTVSVMKKNLWTQFWAKSTLSWNKGNSKSKIWSNIQADYVLIFWSSSWRFFFHQEIERKKEVLYLWKQVSTYIFTYYVRFIFVERCLLSREIRIKSRIFNEAYLDHGGLYRWRENSLPIFFISETKRDFDFV